MTTTYNKLIRDKVLTILDTKGISHTEHIAGDEEYEQKLMAKLLEKAAEVATEESDEKQKEELADLLEVIEAIKELKGFTTEEIEDIRLDKLDERGGFTKRIILEES
jgi:predicted house-cleaning noncanonical NTP pyrophosphatase (MazG superfamily)